MTPDARTTALRDGLASAALEGMVRARSYAQPRRMVCALPAAAIRAAPAPEAEQHDQLLFGEGFDVLDGAAGFAWGQAVRDGYVGYVQAAALTDGVEAPTHRVAAAAVHGFAAPDIKSPASGPYSMNVLLVVQELQGAFARAAGAGWFAARRLSPIGVFETDPAAVAERFLGAPYLWGGREAQGLDCSGLVQQALFACGLACPRDTDQQAGLGHPIAAGELGRGDLVFWADHVAITLDRERIIHANAFHMETAAEPLAEAAVRIERAGFGRPTAYRRLGIGAAS